MPDYTIKSQRLAQVESTFTKPQENIPEWKKPDYVPKSYGELIEIAEQRAIEKLREQAIEEDTQKAEVAKQVDATIADIRKTDSKLDENALFQHATKYGFRDLKQAYNNMQAIRNAEIATEQRVLKNLKGRQDPVSGVQGGGNAPTGSDPNIGRKYGSALEYFQRIKGN